MSSITIYTIDPLLNKRLKQLSREQGKSKNKLVKELLASSLGLPAEGRYPDEYSEFCGLWTVKESGQFDSRQKSNRKIDTRDWE